MKHKICRKFELEDSLETTEPFAEEYLENVARHFRFFCRAPERKSALSCACAPAAVDSLDVALLDALLVQVLDELIAFHPVDEWADVTAVAEERPARQVHGSSCVGGTQKSVGKMFSREKKQRAANDNLYQIMLDNITSKCIFVLLLSKALYSIASHSTMQGNNQHVRST